MDGQIMIGLRLCLDYSATSKLNYNNILLSGGNKDHVCVIWEQGNAHTIKPRIGNRLSKCFSLRGRFSHQHSVQIQQDHSNHEHKVSSKKVAGQR